MLFAPLFVGGYCHFGREPSQLFDKIAGFVLQIAKVAMPHPGATTSEQIQKTTRERKFRRVAQKDFRAGAALNHRRTTRHDVRRLM